uniref:Uncharacterized protein n=1 Tax=Panagrolaimus sp. PS1159 TaxID=55785 RepID=A0AC35G406_9BILA
MTEPFSPTVSLPPDFSDVIERLEERDENERTPLLTAGSVISVVTDPGNFGGGRTIEEEYFPSTSSRSIDGRRQIQNERGGGGRRRRRRLRTVRRVHSESDIRNPRVTRLRR